MKKLLLILFVLAGINCQAQQKPIYEQRIKYRPDAIQCVIDQMFDQVYARIDSLEKRITKLEDGIKRGNQDSLSLYVRNFDYDKMELITDSIKVPGKRYKK
jgi:hypothetical protein